MRKPGRKRGRRDPEATAAALLDAAEKEFNVRGFDGTDTNRIARAAGYAPQSFYRHYCDKTAIFLAVYDRWWKGEMATLAKLGRGSLPSGEAAARVALAFHIEWRGFRRSLRHLAIADPAVRAARTAARRAQIDQLRRLSGNARSDAELLAALLRAERLCDAVAEEEWSDLGLSVRTARKAVAEAMSDLLTGHRGKK